MQLRGAVLASPSFFLKYFFGLLGSGWPEGRGGWEGHEGASEVLVDSGFEAGFADEDAIGCPAGFVAEDGELRFPERSTLALLLLAGEAVLEAIDGVLVGTAVAAHAVKEGGLQGGLRGEEGGGEGGGGLDGGLVLLNLLDGGIGDGHLHGVDAADAPEGLGDAEDGEFFGLGLWLVTGDEFAEKALEVAGRFVAMDGVVAEEGVVA